MPITAPARSSGLFQRELQDPLAVKILGGEFHEVRPSALNAERKGWNSKDWHQINLWLHDA